LPANKGPLQTSYIIFGPNTLWQYDAVANLSMVFNSSGTFTSPGEYLIAAEVFWNGGFGGQSRQGDHQ